MGTARNRLIQDLKPGHCNDIMITPGFLNLAPGDFFHSVPYLEGEKPRLGRTELTKDF